jgi:hypothetical protein
MRVVIICYSNVDKLWINRALLVLWAVEKQKLEIFYTPSGAIALIAYII